ncbi:MAG TPA: peptidoglycan recognition family protein [Chloroflexia bacterium]|nr:peptidoglycan recognition family protein [Chloroflexia bacterium]
MTNPTTSPSADEETRKRLEALGLYVDMTNATPMSDPAKGNSPSASNSAGSVSAAVSAVTGSASNAPSTATSPASGGQLVSVYTPNVPGTPPDTLAPSTPTPEPAPPAPQAGPSYDPNAYKIVWMGSPNFWNGRDGQAVVAICDHIMEGTMESSNGWFKNRRSDASAHFGVGRDGRIWQWVKVEDAAWTNGIMESPDMSIPWLAECARRNINPNNRTIGIEHEGNTGNPFPEEQYKATLWLHRYLCSTYNISTDRQHIVGHYQITAHSRARCPGTGFPWQRLMQDLASSIPQGQPGNGGSNNWTDGVSGLVKSNFGPGTVNSNNAYVRTKPSLSGQDGTLVRVLPKGKTLRFSGYTDAGPAFRGGSRWYLISDADGGGWIHSSMISYFPA